MTVSYLKLGKKSTVAVEQTAATVDILDAIEAARMRVSYYLGSSDSHAIFQIIKEPTDNCFDEVSAGRNDFVGVWVEPGHKYTVWDHGGGIPVDIHRKSKRPTIIDLFSEMHSGGKFGSKAYSEAAGTKGCFVYDTPIALLNGKNIAIGKLAEQCQKNPNKYFWVYSNNSKGNFKFEPAKATAFPTKIVNRLAVVTLDNGEVVKSTIDHPYKAVNGKYIQARHLKKGQSLCSLNLKYDKDGYLQYYDSKQGATLRVNRAVAAMRGDDIVDNDVHHKNGVKHDNRPSNLKTMGRWDHLKNDLKRNLKLKKNAIGTINKNLSKSNSNIEFIHSQVVGKVSRVCVKLKINNLKINCTNYDKNRYHGCPTWKNAKEFITEAIEKANLVLKEGRAFWNGRWLSLDEYISYKVGLSKKSIVNNQSEEMKLKRGRGKILRLMSALLANNKKITKSSYEEIRLKTQPNAPKYDKVINNYFAGFSNLDIKIQAENYNHKVVSVKIIKVKPTQVYALTVEPNHNYLLGCGVFVKNTHGVGVTVTNALSAKLEIWTYKDDNWHNIVFKKGKVVVPLNTKSKPPTLPQKTTHGSIVQFTPDFDCFDAGSKLNIKTLKDYMQLQAFLHPKVKVYLKTPKNEYHFQEKDGLKSLLEKQIADLGEEALGKPFLLTEGPVSVALSWSKNAGENLVSYASGSLTKDGGTHTNGLNDAIRDALKPYREKYDFTPAEARDGLVGTLNVSVKQPKFTSQSKDKLASESATKEVYAVVKPALDAYLKSNKTLVKIIVQRAADLHKSYARFTADRKNIAALKNKKNKALLSSKLSRAKTKDLNSIELFLCEGDSAGGCHFGETRVLLADGSTKSFIQLIEDEKSGQKNNGIAYDIKNQKAIPFELSNPHLTKYVKEYIEIEFEDGYIWRGTTDHPWLLNQGVYRNASELQPGDDIRENQHPLNLVKI